MADKKQGQDVQVDNPASYARTITEISKQVNESQQSIARWITQSTNAITDSRKRDWVIWVIWVLVLAAVIAFGLVYLFVPRKENKTNDPAPPKPPATKPVPTPTKLRLGPDEGHLVFRHGAATSLVRLPRVGDVALRAALAELGQATTADQTTHLLAADDPGATLELSAAAPHAPRYARLTEDGANRWVLEPAGDGAVRIRNARTPDRMLYVDERAPADKPRHVTNDARDTKWRVLPAAAGAVHLQEVPHLAGLRRTDHCLYMGTHAEPVHMAQCPKGPHNGPHRADWLLLPRPQAEFQLRGRHVAVVQRGAHPWRLELNGLAFALGFREAHEPPTSGLDEQSETVFLASHEPNLV